MPGFHSREKLQGGLVMAEQKGAFCSQFSPFYTHASFWKKADQRQKPKAK
jgi:hypothetical protein